MSVRLHCLLVCAVLLPCAARAGEQGRLSGGTAAAAVPSPRVRVSISPDGSRAAIREAASGSASLSRDFSAAPLPGAGETETPLVSEPLPGTGGPRVLARLHGREITDADVVEELLERRGRETLEWIIGRGILEQELDRLGLEVTDKEVSARFAEHLDGLRRAFPGVTRAGDLTRTASGMNAEEYRERSVWAELALRKIMRASLRPTAEQLRGYYAERQADFIQPERVRLSQVFIPPQAGPDSDGIADDAGWNAAERQILEAHTRIRMGEDFAEVARAYGSGGQLSRWAGRGELLRELEDAAFAVSAGSTTAPIRSSMGFHILMVEEKIQRKIPPFEEVREDVQSQFEERQFLLQAGEFMARLRDGALKSGGLVIPPEGEAFPGTAP